MVRFVTLLLLVILMAAPSLFADRRKYVWTYQFATIAEEATELEFYQTSKLKSEKANSWEYRIEIEHGLTDRWDFSVYQIFSQNEGEPLKWHSFQLRTRYKLARQGEFFMDPLLYLEYNRQTDLKARNKLEGKLILARDIDRWNISLNPVYEFFWAPGDPKHEIGLDVGLSYEFHPKLALGLESTSRIEYEDGKDAEKGSYFGPTVSIASGRMFYSAGYAFGLTDDSDDARVRFIMGVGL